MHQNYKAVSLRLSHQQHLQTHCTEQYLARRVEFSFKVAFCLLSLCAGDFPIFAKCKGETEGENGYCCKSSSATDDCYARDLAHGGYSCDETYRSTGAINAHCCYSCT